ncbi:hypothetical protein GCM10007079_41470 [Nocardiopsis terrae]|uniref:Pyridoxamine 5'-phosphate oxidase n=1 Tax=Nocardiopsis terrae TaxID=372655 RepID=A0ABR9HMF4_9ACTN|nr:hypothetical protein [Nocardiopsis terrae]MBE1460035.1 hypothetical protein [Nocardiopsis terrae]GHC92809.1 hypothetical protein GCM10007079_41470 [Nocardiopsis terrae]
MKHRTVCDIREVGSVTVLRKLAHLHRSPVSYAGPDIYGHPVYLTRFGSVERVARGDGRDPTLRR